MHRPRFQQGDVPSQAQEKARRDRLRRLRVRAVPSARCGAARARVGEEWMMRERRTCILPRAARDLFFFSEGSTQLLRNEAGLRASLPFLPLCNTLFPVHNPRPLRRRVRTWPAVRSSSGQSAARVDGRRAGWTRLLPSTRTSCYARVGAYLRVGQARQSHVFAGDAFAPSPKRISRDKPRLARLRGRGGTPRRVPIAVQNTLPDAPTGPVISPCVQRQAPG